MPSMQARPPQVAMITTYIREKPDVGTWVGGAGVTWSNDPGTAE